MAAITCRRRPPFLPSADNFPITSRSERWKKRVFSYSLQRVLDRVNVLSGHTGCVNALSWAKNGQLLLSAGDDTTVRLWRIDTTDTTTHYPFFCESIIRTDHRDNIFNAHMLPYSTRIVTVAGDREIRIFDIEGGGRSLNGRETEHSFQSASGRVLRCHTDRVKRIVTEDNPDKFLTVAEDGQVRQHDLRTPHTCRSGCPAPLIKMGHELSTLSLSQLTPYQFVVAGESPYGYLFDRRNVGRFLQEEWGVAALADDVAMCVRRFGRVPETSRGLRNRGEHVFGARMSESNGHEVLLSYRSDAVYLYSTRDEPRVGEVPIRSSMISPNHKRRKLDKVNEYTTNGSNESSDSEVMVKEEDHLETRSFPLESDDGDDDGEDEEEVMGTGSKVPLILPRRRFSGACNLQTVKDVNFLGPDDEYVTSGSDDGNVFLWRKSTGDLHGIFEGDSSIVNVVEGHPHFPLVAVSGLDSTVKLFGPVHGTSAFSKMDDAANIIERNIERTRQAMVRTADIARFFRLHYRRQLLSDSGGETNSEPLECSYQ